MGKGRDGAVSRNTPNPGTDAFSVSSFSPSLSPFDEPNDAILFGLMFDSTGRSGNGTVRLLRNCRRCCVCRFGKGGSASFLLSNLVFGDGTVKLCLFGKAGGPGVDLSFLACNARIFWKSLI